MTSSTSTYAAWQRLSGRPGGSRLFSVAAMARVPYFASVLPHVVRMEPGLAEVRVSEVVLRKACRGFATVAAAPRAPGAQARAAASAWVSGKMRSSTTLPHTTRLKFVPR
jgi:Domain of unknown function (DUF4442)